MLSCLGYKESLLKLVTDSGFGSILRMKLTHESHFLRFVSELYPDQVIRYQKHESGVKIKVFHFEPFESSDTFPNDFDKKLTDVTLEA